MFILMNLTLVKHRRNIAWILVAVTVTVFLSGYYIRIFEVEEGTLKLSHYILGGIFASISLPHIYISVLKINFSWMKNFRLTRRIQTREIGLLRLFQMFTGLILIAVGSLVLFSGLDWFKIGTGWLLPFTTHIWIDYLLWLGLTVHVFIGLRFALKRREIAHQKIVVKRISRARRDAIILIGGALLTILAGNYLDRIPIVSETIDQMKRALPPDQYEVVSLRVLHINGMPNPDEPWGLEIDGLVNNPISFSLDEVKALPYVINSSDFHCVTGWTKFSNRWRGVRLSTLVDVVKPFSNASYAVFHAYLGYTTSLPLRDLKREDVVIAYGLDGGNIPPRHGGPLRLVVPHKYGYKSAKWVRRITFVDDNELGYWETRGYSDSANPFTNDRYSRLPT
jgi:hypothetical protein